MKRLTKSQLIYALLPIAILVSFAPLAVAADKEVTKWEYRVIRIDDSRPDQAGGRPGRGSAEEQLNKLGAEGWELVSVRIDSQANRNSPIFYLKRPVGNGSPKKAPAEKPAAEK